MNSDDDCDIFSAETNVTAITKLNDGNNSDDGTSNSVLSKLRLLNDVSTAMTLHIWEENKFAPEADFIEMLKAIDGISTIETQTYTVSFIRPQLWDSILISL